MNIPSRFSKYWFIRFWIAKLIVVAITPVNIIIGALVLKELFGLSDDDMVESLMFNHRFQYALHTTSYEEQSLSDKSLSRFRIRCYDYESIHGVDLYHDCVKDLAEKNRKDDEDRRSHSPDGFDDAGS